MAPLYEIVYPTVPTITSLPNITLPIDDALPELCTALSQHDEVLLQAPPGAGKTTRVPLVLLESEWLKGQKILMLEPRRVAAINAANQMAALLGEPVGQTVGYRIRGEVKVSQRTRIEVVTEGLLTRWLLDDTELTGVGLVIFDEFHERSLNTDLGLALCLQARELFRETPLKLLIMSATLNSRQISQLIPDIPVVTSAGRSFPVDIRYLAKPLENAQKIQAACQAVVAALNQEHGDILVFLPGVAEINRAEALLRETLHNALDDNLLCLPLHGSLPLNAQQRAIAPAREHQRKIVLATDIAETSLTIVGIRIVIDCGLARSPQFDPKNAVTRLHTHTISHANAEQRAGRAGRTQPGICYRLWTANEHATLRQFAAPEIAQADLAPLALTCLTWGVNSPDELLWLDPPKEAHWQQALDLLVQLGAFQSRAVEQSETIKLGAMNSSHPLTATGQAMSQLACHPRLARMLIEALHRKQSTLGSLLAAALSDRIPRTAGSDIAHWINDITNLTDASTGASKAHIKKDPSIARIHALSRQFQQALAGLACDNTIPRTSPQEPLTPGELLAFGFPDRVAKKQRQQNDRAFYLMANGRRASIGLKEPLAHHEWLCICEVGGHAGRQDDTIFCGAPIAPETFADDLKPLTHVREIAEWDDSKNRFVASRQRCIGKCVIDSEPITNIDTQLRINALCELIAKKGLAILTWSPEAQELRQRMQFIFQLTALESNPTRLAQAEAKILAEAPTYSWPDVSDQALIASASRWLAPFLEAVKSLDDLQKVDLYQALLSLLNWPMQQQLEHLAPAKIEIPSGRQASIDYSYQPPVLAVKLQEMFGCQSTPTIANGKVKLCVHLLSPAGRPLQVTQDLPHFWQTSYHDVKKDMKGRYPKHPWPDDPTTATATAKTKRHSQNPAQ